MAKGRVDDGDVTIKPYTGFKLGVRLAEPVIVFNRKKVMVKYQRRGIEYSGYTASVYNMCYVSRTVEGGPYFRSEAGSEYDSASVFRQDEIVSTPNIPGFVKDLWYEFHCGFSLAYRKSFACRRHER